MASPSLHVRLQRHWLSSALSFIWLIAAYPWTLDCPEKKKLETTLYHESYLTPRCDLRKNMPRLSPTVLLSAVYIYSPGAFRAGPVTRILMDTQQSIRTYSTAGFIRVLLIIAHFLDRKSTGKSLKMPRVTPCSSLYFLYYISVFNLALVVKKKYKRERFYFVWLREIIPQMLVYSFHRRSHDATLVIASVYNITSTLCRRASSSSGVRFNDASRWRVMTRPLSFTPKASVEQRAKVKNKTI